MAKERRAVVTEDAGEMTIEELRDLHRKLGYLGHAVSKQGMKLDFFAAQRDIEDLIRWE